MQNPILKVLSTLTDHQVRHLLMGGQACVFYGAAQFSRDVDLAVLANGENLDRLRQALDDLEADVIAIPPFEAQYLRRGLAVHFRCRRPDVAGLRVDIMSQMRGVDAFPQLWDRRTTLQLETGQTIDLLSVTDLVQAKKTQRDKDWPMIRALVDAHYEQHREEASESMAAFWLREGRSPGNLVTLASRYPQLTAELTADRPLLQFAVKNSTAELAQALSEEQKQLQELDRTYWQPLESELEQIRHHRTRKKQPPDDK